MPEVCRITSRKTLINGKSVVPGGNEIDTPEYCQSSWFNSDVYSSDAPKVVLWVNSSIVLYFSSTWVEIRRIFHTNVQRVCREKRKLSKNVISIFYPLYRVCLSKKRKMFNVQIWSQHHLHAAKFSTKLKVTCIFRCSFRKYTRVYWNSRWSWCSFNFIYNYSSWGWVT